jgi:CRISPR-associated protein Csx16
MKDKRGRAALGRRFAVTRHKGAAEWIRARFPNVEVVDHLTPEQVGPGDIVIGTLPVNLAAAVIAQGADFQHLSLDLPAEARGRELTAEIMDQYGARIERYDVWPARVVFGRNVPQFRRLVEIAVAGKGARCFFILGILLGLVLPNLLASALWDYRFDLAAVYFMLTAAIVVGIYSWRHRVLSSRIVEAKEFSPRQVLVMGLSRLPSERRAEALEVIAWAKNVDLPVLALSKKGLEARLSALAGEGRGSEDADIATCKYLQDCARRDGPPFPWQQNLRALNKQLPRLRAVIIVTSPQSRDDYLEFEKLMFAVLERAGYPSVLVSRCSRVADFEDHAQLVVAFRESSTLAGKWGAKPRDLCIDVTAGQKIFSIAAAIATLNGGTVFSYVNNDGAVSVYDASIEIAQD